VINFRKTVFLAAICVLASPAFAAQAPCDRACLEQWVDTYLDAAIAHNPQAARLAPNVRFTANGQRLPIGDGFWRTIQGKGKFRLFVTDVPAQQVTVLTTFIEQGTDPAGAGGALALRLKIANGQISEIEQIEIRSHAQYQRMEAFGKPRAGLLATVPTERRMSRARMIETANKYFTGMQMNDGKGDYPFSARCDRYENGNHATNAPTPAGQTRPDPATATGYSDQWTCLEQFRSGLLRGVSLIRDRRFVAVDAERGLVWAFGFFDHHQVRDTETLRRPGQEPATVTRRRPWTWHIAEVFKVEDGLIHEVEAYLYEPPYGMLSGWSSFEDGMSDRLRDETGVR
jgi:hypothetical protein